MRSILIVLATLGLAGCVIDGGPAQRPAPLPPPARPAEPPHPAHPVGRPVAHPHLPLDPAGAASVAQAWAWERGWPTVVQQVKPDAGGYLVNLKVTGGHHKGKLRLLVDAHTAALAVIEQKVRPHDRGRHQGHKGRHGDWDDE